MNLDNVILHNLVQVQRMNLVFEEIEKRKQATSSVQDPPMPPVFLKVDETTEKTSRCTESVFYDSSSEEMSYIDHVENMKKLDEITHDSHLSKDDRALTQTFDFCERYNYTGDDDEEKSEDLSDVEKGLLSDDEDEEKGMHGVLNRYYDTLAERKREREKTAKKRNKTKNEKLYVETVDRSVEDPSFEKNEEKFEKTLKENEKDDDEFTFFIESVSFIESAGQFASVSTMSKSTKRKNSNDGTSTESHPLKIIKHEQNGTSPSKPFKKKSTNVQKTKSHSKILSQKKNNFINAQTITKIIKREISDLVKAFQIQRGTFMFDFDGEENDTVSAQVLLGQSAKSKRVRSKAAELRKKIGDEAVTKSIPFELKKIDEKLLQIDLASETQENRVRWRKASYVWNEKGFLLSKYYYLIEKKDTQGNYVWN